ncbi:hypothetical protein [Lederbergia galactosidilytica]|nr:hypothetical protein [Lederbergia galactosidilytica]MBP1914261.1 hypothetical protein [Lederbergia galactosidilytica]
MRENTSLNEVFLHLQTGFVLSVNLILILIDWRLANNLYGKHSFAT